MKVNVIFRGKKKVLDLAKDSKVNEIFSSLDINPETVIIKRDKEIILEDEILKDSDNIELVRIISGG